MNDTKSISHGKLAKKSKIVEKISKVQKVLDEINSKIDVLKTQWEKEKSSIKGEVEIKAEIEQVKHQIEQAQRDYNLELAAKLQYGKLPELIEQLKNCKSQERKNTLLKEEIDEEDIASIISKWTGVPISKLVEEESEKLLIILGDILYHGPRNPLPLGYEPKKVIEKRKKHVIMVYEKMRTQVR